MDLLLINFHPEKEEAIFDHDVAAKKQRSIFQRRKKLRPSLSEIVIGA